MASGTPLVASRTGALPEVTGDAAVLVTPGDAEELCAALRTLHDSPAERERLSQAALAQGGRALRLAGGGQGDGRRVPAGDRGEPGAQGTLDCDGRAGRAMLTVDFRRLPIQPGTRLLDLGCGAGRHAFEAARRGAEVVALDTDHGELHQVSAIAAAMAEAGEIQAPASITVAAGDATRMPFPSGSFDIVIAAEVLEHITTDQSAMNEIARVLRPGGIAAVTVPAWLPERICWALSDDYHNVPGGHVRIFTRTELEIKLRRAGPVRRRPPPRACAALAVLVAEMRGRRAQRRPPAG